MNFSREAFTAKSKVWPRPSGTLPTATMLCKSLMWVLTAFRSCLQSFEMALATFAFVVLNFNKSITIVWEAASNFAAVAII